MEIETFEVVEAHYTTFGRVPKKEPSITTWLQRVENQNAHKSGRVARVVHSFTVEGSGDTKRIIVKWVQE